MNFNLRPLIVLWGVLAASVLVLIVWRKSVARNEDDQFHVLHTEARAAAGPVAQKLEHNR